MTRTLTALVGLAMLATACGGDDGADAAPTVIIDGEIAAGDTDAGDGDTGETEAPDGDQEATASDDLADPSASDEELALEFAQCMRDNGVPAFTDPVVNADGSIDIVPTGPAAEAIDPGDPQVQEAIDTCGEIIAGASFLPGADLDPAELEDDLLAMAQCLRDLGHDADDPDLSAGIGPGAGGPQTLFGPDFDPLDPANADDIETCQAEVFGPDGPPGFGQGGN